MPAPQFRTPLSIPLTDDRLGTRVAVIDGPRAGLAAMTQHGLGDYQMADMAWQLAFKCLTRAVLEPTPDNLDEARTALEILARRRTSPRDLGLTRH